MRDWYIVCITQGKEVSKWMKGGWTGQGNLWGWQAGDLCLELQQRRLKSVSESGQGGHLLSSEMPRWTCRYWFMFHWKCTDSSRNMAICTIFDPKLVREEISVHKTQPFCISHRNKSHILAVVQIYLCRQKAMIAINHSLPRADFETPRSPFSMAEAVTS